MRPTVSWQKQLAPTSPPRCSPGAPSTGPSTCAWCAGACKQNKGRQKGGPSRAACRTPGAERSCSWGLQGSACQLRALLWRGHLWPGRRPAQVLPHSPQAACGTMDGFMCVSWPDVTAPATPGGAAGWRAGDLHVGPRRLPPEQESPSTQREGRARVEEPTPSPGGLCRGLLRGPAEAPACAWCQAELWSPLQPLKGLRRVSRSPLQLSLCDNNSGKQEPVLARSPGEAVLVTSSVLCDSKHTHSSDSTAPGGQRVLSALRGSLRWPHGTLAERGGVVHKCRSFSYRHLPHRCPWASSWAWEDVWSEKQQDWTPSPSPRPPQSKRLLSCE